jgi:hypothetical protein
MSGFLPKRHEHIAFGFVLTFMMTFVVAGISTILAVGLSDPALMRLWFRAWMSSWVVAFPAILVLAPLTRRIVARFVIRQ